MPKLRPRPHSRITRQALTLLGRQVRVGRKERRMTVQALADRVGVSRGLIQRIEKGDPGCQVGSVFEAAVVAGVTLFDASSTAMNLGIKETDQRLALLPRHTHADRKGVKDDF